jgi:putative flippase GtrA
VRRLLKLARYAAVSAISTTLSLTVLGLLVGTNAAPAGWANVIATLIGTVPSFELNRRWVWNKTGRRSVATEIGPFVALSFAELGLSTMAVSAAARWTSAARFGTTAHTLAAETANIATFGSLWIVQYVILDRLLFRPSPERGVSKATTGTHATAEGADSAYPEFSGCDPGRPTVVSQPAMSATTAGSMCWAGSYSAGVDRPVPVKKKWLSDG